MKIPFIYKFVLVFSAIWIAWALLTEFAAQGGDMRGLGLYLGGLPYVKFDVIDPLWRQSYCFRIVLLIFNSAFWGFVIGGCIMLLKKIVTYLIRWRPGSGK